MRRMVQLNLPLGDVPEVVWYRYNDPWEKGDDPSLFEYRVVRETPKGVVLDEYGYEKLKFVLKEARKRFAYPTRELALESYLARKERQVSILAARHDAAAKNLEAARAFQKRGFGPKETVLPDGMGTIKWYKHGL